MTPFLKQVRSQGWKLYEIGKIRGLKKRQMTELSKSPTQWDWLALKGLGDKEKKLVDLTYDELMADSTPITGDEETELQALCDGVVLGDKREEEG